MTANTVTITFVDSKSVILNQFNTTDDFDFLYDILDKLAHHLTPEVKIALEVAMEEMALIQEEEAEAFDTAQAEKRKGD
jgi:hypothetical protein